MKTDPKHNFFAHRCREIDGNSIHRSACNKRIMRLRGKDQYAAEMFPECARALKRGRCPAEKMMAEEFGQRPKYYLDRDDAGPGVASRKDLGLPDRTDEERAFHHKIAEENGIRINEAKTPTYVRRDDPVVPIPATTASKPKPIKTGAFTMNAGDHINAAVKEMQNA